MKRILFTILLLALSIAGISQPAKNIRLADFDWPLKGFALTEQYDYDSTGELVQSPIPSMAFPTTVNLVDDTHLSLVGLVPGGNVEITVEVDLYDGSFSIPDGTLIATTTHGNVGMFNAEEANSPIIGIISEDGFYITGFWYDKMLDGEYAGFRYSSRHFYFTSSIVAANGKMSYSKSGNQILSDVYIDQNGSKVTVHNFGGENSPIVIDMKEDNKFEISSQLAAQMDGYGDFYTYSLNEDLTGVESPTITGTGQGNVLTFDAGWTFYSTNDLWFGTYSATTITRSDGADFIFPEIDDVGGVLSLPTIVNLNEYDPPAGFGTILVDIPSTDEYGNMLDESNLYYIFYSDIDGEVSPITLTSDLYQNLNEDVTEIPYTLNDDWDFDIFNNHKRVFLNFDYSSYTRIGLQGVYYDGDERLISNIYWMYLKEPKPKREFVLIELPDGAEINEWTYDCYSIEVDGTTGEKTYIPEYSRHIYIAFVGDKVYFQGLSDYSQDSWLVGTLSNGVITIPANEYVGPFILGFTYELFSNKMTFSYDSENAKITGAISIRLYKNDTTWDDTDFDYSEMSLVTDVPGTPATPQVTKVKLSGTSYPFVNIDIPARGIDGNTMSVYNLWYRLMITRTDGTCFEYTCKASDYDNLNEDLVWIPYTLDDGWDFYYGGELFYVYDDDLSTWKYIEVQSKYEKDGETFYSDTYLYDILNNVNIPNHIEMSGGEWSENYWATYYNSHWGYVADANTTVYVATLSHENTQLLLEEVPDKIIPPGQAVILRSTSADGFKLTFTDNNSTFDFTENALSGVDEATAVPTDQGTIYTLSIKDGRMAFRKFTGSTLGAHKAYLAINSDGDSPIRISFDEGATDISDIAEDSKESDGYYTLDGRHFKGVPTMPGIYIINGKKAAFGY